MPIFVIFRSVGGAVSYDSGTLTLLFENGTGESTGLSQSYPPATLDTLDTTVGNLNTPNVADVEDQPIVAFNDDVDPTMGDGSMSVTLLYTILAV